MTKISNLYSLTNYIDVNSNGNVVIAAPTSGFALDVTGTGRFTGQLTLGSSITNGTFTYTLPSATGTLALTSALGSYLPLSGGTLTGALNGTSATFSGDILRTSSNVGGINEIAVVNSATSGSSSSRIRIQTAVTGATTLGDAITQYTDNNNFNWCTGSGVTTSRDFVITNHFTLGTNVFFRLASSTGAATFSNSITAPSGINAVGQQKAFSWQRTSGTPSDVYSLNADSGSAYLQNDTTSGIIMTWLEGGNVGINTTSSTGKLGIYGSAIGDIPLVITHAWGGSSTALISASNASAEVFKVDRNGVATFSSTVTANQFISNATNVGDEYYFFKGNGAVSNNFTAYAYSNTVYLNAYNSLYLRANNTGGSGGNIILQGGNVGIGTTAPSSILDVNTGINTSSGTAIVISQNTNGAVKGGASFGLSIQNGGESTNAADLWFRTASGGTLSERMRITSGGNVGIGTTSPGELLHLSKATYPIIKLTETTASTSAQFGYDSPTSEWRMRTLTSTPLTFGTNDTERMRIMSTGNIRFFITPAVDTNLEWFNTGNSTVQARIWADGNPRLNVQVNGTGGVYVAPGGTSWTAASDERLKTNLTPIENGIDKVNQLRSVTGRYLTDDESKSRSFLIAQDILSVLPEAVDIDTETGMMGVQYTEVIPLLVASIKELSAKVTALENK